MKYLDLVGLNYVVLKVKNLIAGKADLVGGKVPSTQLPPDTVTSVAGKTGAVALTKADVGLASVDNTSDANKPISVAVQTALNNKSDKTHTHTKANIGLSNVTNIGIIFLTESQYKALSSKDPNILYVRGE